MKIAVLGAGIGGLTTAIALKKHNINVQVFEATDQIRAVGAGIWMPPNAMRIFDQLEVGENIRKVGLELTKIEIKDQFDKPISKIDGEWLNKNFGCRSVSIERTKLHEVLAHSLSEDQIYLNHACEKVEQTDDKVILTFANGKQKSFDYLIAADGIKSVGRQVISPKRPLRYSGQTCFRGISSADNLDLLQGGSVEYWGDGIRFGLSPIGENKCYWYSTIVQEAGIRYSQEDIKKLLIKAFAQFPESVRGILGTLGDINIIQTDLFDLLPSSEWVNKRIVLLGDAAHATTPNLGQGGAMAVEDAYLLAQEIAKNKNMEDAFKKYCEERKERVHFIVDTSYKIGQMSNSTNKTANKIRNFLMSKTPQWIMEKQLNKVYRSGLF